MASTYEMVNRAMEGGLPTRLKAMREQGLSLQGMADQFAQEGYEVSFETVRRWCAKAEIPTHRVPAS